MVGNGVEEDAPARDEEGGGNVGSLCDAVMEACPDALLVFDGEGRVVRTNVSSKRLLKRTDLEGVAADSFFSPWPLPADPAPCPVRGEVRLPDGAAIPVDACAAMFAGSQRGGVLWFRDTSPQREIARRLDDARRQLLQAEKLASIGKLAAGIAHEINNPLAGVVMYAALVLERMDPADANYDDLRSVVEEAGRCRDIVRDLLEYARPAPFAMQPVDIGYVVQTALKLLVKKTLFRKLCVELQFEEGLPPVTGDPNRLRQVMVNLVINAVEAMDGKGTLTVRANRVGGKVRIEVADTGPGIAPEDLPRVFDPFFTTKEVGKGTGLGLSVTYSIVHQHGGTIRVETRRGAGSTFVVELPVAGKGCEQAASQS